MDMMEKVVGSSRQGDEPWWIDDLPNVPWVRRPDVVARGSKVLEQGKELPAHKFMILSSYYYNNTT